MAGQRSGAVVIPPPVMGWNTRDPLSQMDPLYSPGPENFIASGGSVNLRKGSAIFTTAGGGDPLDYILAGAEYIKSDGTRILIAVSGFSGFPYSVTTSGTATDISGGISIIDITGIALYFCNFNGRIFMKSNNDIKDVYDWSGTGNITAPAFVGPGGDDKALRQMCVYKGRLYFCGTDAKVWYTPDVGAITGTMTSFDFASIFPNGGTLIHCDSISPNPTNNREQYFIAVSSSGDILMYGGDYPGDPNWGILGIYYAGSPIDSKSFITFQNDLLIITTQGLVSVLAIIGGTPLNDAYLSDIVGSAFQEYAAAALAIGGTPTTVISGVYYPSGNYILINFVTASSPRTYKQFIFYTVNKSWWLFSGYDELTQWVNFNNKLYFFARNISKIFQADTGSSNVTSTGAALSTTIKLRHAFNYLGNNIANKVFTMAIPTIYQSEGLSLTLDCDVDYTDVTATSTETDTTDTAYKLYQPRMGLTNQVNGSAVSIRIDGTVGTKRMSLQATKVYWLEGGID